MMRALTAILLFATACRVAAAADYEIQIYGSQTAPPGSTFAELHSNLTTDGPAAGENAERQPAAHALHETLELTRGFTDWFETGVYLFTSARDGEGWDWAGSHVRPRVRVPDSWGWPIGASLSMEVGYWRPRFSEARWDMEIRPIWDWKRGRFTIAVNPAFERDLRPYGDGSRSFEFTPGLKVSYAATALLTPGLEYYSNLGPVEKFHPRPEQEHLLFPVVDLALSPEWEFNAGAGIGLTRASDKRLFKLIVGRQF